MPEALSTVKDELSVWRAKSCRSEFAWLARTLWLCEQKVSVFLRRPEYGYPTRSW